MGTSVSCIPPKNTDAERLDTEKVHSIQWTNLKQYKRYDELGENASVLVMTTKQQTGNQNIIQEQDPVVDKDDFVKPERLEMEIIRTPEESENHSQQQVVPRSQVPIQVKPKKPQNVHFPYFQNPKLSAMTGRGRKFPQPTTMPEPLVQILAAEEKEEANTFKFNDKVTPRAAGSAALMFSTVPEHVDFLASESMIASEEKFFANSEEELVRNQNPTLDAMWGIQFMRESVLSESSDVEEEVESREQSCHTVDAKYSDETSYDEASVIDYEFEGSSVLTLDIDTLASDGSSIYGAFEDDILTDYKCYKYCLLDDDGLETKVHVKILKDLSQALLHKAGIVPEENPVLFGVDPSLKLQRVYDHGEDLWVVSEHDVDITLKDVLSGGGTGWPEVCPLAKTYITSELIKKFAILHEQGIYMKNFGSASVLLAKDGRVCVNNFLESALQKLKHQLVTGPEYMETLQWNPLSTDGQRKKDIYRLGQVIGKLMVGNKFQQWIRNGDNIEAMLLTEDVPKPIVQIISRCLRSREETVYMDEINSFASFYFSFGDLCSGRLELQQYLNFNIIVA